MKYYINKNWEWWFFGYFLKIVFGFVCFLKKKVGINCFFIMKKIWYFEKRMKRKDYIVVKGRYIFMEYKWRLGIVVVGVIYDKVFIY